MVPSLNELEGLLGFELSEIFTNFWEAYVPDKASAFEVRKRALNGPFAHLGPHPTCSGAWLIEVEESLPREHCEVSLAHEIVHLALTGEGYPVIASGEKPQPQESVWAEIAANLHSVLMHSIVWFRLRESSFSVDDHIRIKSTGQLRDLRSKINGCPSRRQFPDWQNWLLQYLLARLEWGGPEREQVREMFAGRDASVGRHGEKCLERMISFGYLEPQKLTPQAVNDAGEWLLKRLGLDMFFRLCQAKRIRVAAHETDA